MVARNSDLSRAFSNAASRARSSSWFARSSASIALSFSYS